MFDSTTFYLPNYILVAFKSMFLKLALFYDARHENKVAVLEGYLSLALEYSFLVTIDVKNEDLTCQKSVSLPINKNGLSWLEFKVGIGNVNQYSTSEQRILRFAKRKGHFFLEKVIKNCPHNLHWFILTDLLLVAMLLFELMAENSDSGGRKLYCP